MDGRIRGLNHFAINAPEPTEVADFAEAFGLEVHDRADSIAVRCAGRDQDQIRVHAGPARTVHHLSFSVAPADLDSVAGRLAQAGVPRTDPPDGGADGGLWTVDPDGNHVHITDTEPAPWAGYKPQPSNQDDRGERWDVAQWKLVPSTVQPRRLMHGLLFSPDVSAMERFYCDVLGLRLSNRIPGKVVFLNAGRGDHHVFGFIGSDRPGFHHCAWEVPNVDAIAVGAESVSAKGFADGWGLGRHTLGSNYFHYVKAPTGMWWEYSCDIDQVTDDWVGTDEDTKPWVWGPAPPADFMANTAD